MSTWVIDGISAGFLYPSTYMNNCIFSVILSVLAPLQRGCQRGGFRKLTANASLHHGCFRLFSVAVKTIGGGILIRFHIEFYFNLAGIRDLLIIPTQRYVSVVKRMAGFLFFSVSPSGSGARSSKKD